MLLLVLPDTMRSLEWHDTITAVPHVLKVLEMRSWQHTRSKCYDGLKLVKLCTRKKRASRGFCELSKWLPNKLFRLVAEQYVGTLHVLASSSANESHLIRQLTTILRSKFSVSDVTIQITLQEL